MYDCDSRICDQIIRFRAPTESRPTAHWVAPSFSVIRHRSTLSIDMMVMLLFARAFARAAASGEYDLRGTQDEECIPRLTMMGGRKRPVSRDQY